MTLHMVLFVEKFNIMDEKELSPLEDLILPLKKYTQPPEKPVDSENEELELENLG